MRKLALVLVVAVAGCGKKGGGPDADKVMKSIDVGGVNALVPKEKKLEFEARVTGKKRAVALVPKDWQKGFLDGEVKPPDNAGFGFFTTYRTSTSCDGECKSKDWAKELQTGHLARVRGDKPPLKDEKVGDNGWLVVVKEDNASTVKGVYLQWKSGGEVYQSCEFTLGEEDVSLQPAFEKACTSLVGLRFDSSSDK